MSTSDEGAAFAVRVLRSSRRRKTVGARMVGDVLQVTVPWWMDGDQEAVAVADMVGRFARRLSTDRFDLQARTSRLARQYGLPEPTEIRWSSSMASRWGSCTPATATIRLSDRLGRFPDWVVDYVIVHELAHLVFPNHSARFWALVNTYPLTERARGYLMAKSGDAELE